MKNITSINIDNDQQVGRLGNKLFVIACGLGLSEKHNLNYVIPNWKYQNDLPNIPITSNLHSLGSIQHYQEKGFHYTPIKLSEGDTLNLLGYYQSYKYFKHIEAELKTNFFLPSDEIKKEIETLFNMVSEYKITSIHVRRGDYINDSTHHPCCSMEYYNNAMESLDKDTDRFLIFSDDINWCRENFKGDKCLFSEGRRDIVDMYMISKCNNHIIANSSFSWWGSWLCQHEDKKIIAPKNWFGESYANYNMEDIRPSEWVQM